MKPFEVKFVVDRETGRRVREASRASLAPDPNASGPASDEYRTTTIYFDTTDLSVYHRRGSYRRAKYRVRRYGAGPVAFLERKLRTADVLSKRRTPVAIDELGRLEIGAAPGFSWSGRWFEDRLRMRRLAPVCQVSYLRTARVGLTENGPIRLTLDEDLAGASTGALAFDEFGSQIPLTDRTILELKFTGRMPAIFKRIVEDFALEPVRVSKYRLAVEGTRGVNPEPRGHRGDS